MRKHREKNLVDREAKETLIKERESTSETEDDSSCTCKDCTNGYKSCLFSTFINYRICVSNVKKTIYSCIGGCFYPIKERCCNCCDNVDRDLNPYKDANYNPYDHL